VITDGRDKIKKGDGMRERESILLTVSDRPRGDVFFLELKRGKLKKSKHNKNMV
jgi:hypothetical protein